MTQPPKFTVVQGNGRESDRTSILQDAILDVIETHADGMMIATVLGTLDMIKHEILRNSEDIEPNE